MSSIILRNISKKYHIRYKKSLSIRDSIIGLFRPPYKRDELWALGDINLNVKKGEALGVIGKNGCGKTTLLKILCGIIRPTRGSMRIEGTISGVLELCAGFQDNLTGRENIYLNGLFLGLSRKEIQKKLDAVIDFADIGNFIDTAVRTYSAGMYMRLGFAIAMCLPEPDILLVDEVIAMGDKAFQDKCLYKMKEFKESGKTIVLVSHDTNLIKRFCDRAILVDQGAVIADGPAEQIIQKYSSLQAGIFVLDGQRMQKDNAPV